MYFSDALTEGDNTEEFHRVCNNILKQSRTTVSLALEARRLLDGTSFPEYVPLLSRIAYIDSYELKRCGELGEGYFSSVQKVCLCVCVCLCVSVCICTFSRYLLCFLILSTSLAALVAPICSG